MEKPSYLGTVGQLRAALEGVPDDTPLIVNVADTSDPECVYEQVVTSTGFGRVDCGDGRGLQPAAEFGISCSWDFDVEDFQRGPGRAAEVPEPEAEL